jgi:FKBP-type peptidyl-prolyl cis-trans isomerase
MVAVFSSSPHVENFSTSNRELIPRGIGEFRVQQLFSPRYIDGSLAYYCNLNDHRNFSEFIKTRSGQKGRACLVSRTFQIPNMIRKFIPGALALGLIATSSARTSAAKAHEKTEDAAPAAKTEVTTPAVTAPAKTDAAAPAVEVPAAPKLDPAVMKSDSSYALGFRTGGGFAQQFGKFGVTADDLEGENFLKGFTAALKGEKPGLEESKLQAAMQALGDMLQTREKATAAKNLEEGKKFLEENGKRKGVITTKSGLQYEVLTKGGEEKYVAPKEGDKSAAEKQFLVNYKGTLINGKVFDASPAGQPVPMTLQVVEGFKEALTNMPVGSKWRLFMPSNLAYGEERRSADIGPNSVLIFDLELVKIQDAPAAPQGGMPFPMPQGGPEGAPHGAPQGE